MKRSLPLVLFLLAAACTSTVRQPAPPVHVVIVGTTDVHGWFNGHVETPPGGGEGVLWGGLPSLGGYVQALREQNGGRVLLVDSGDMFQGTLESNIFEGEALIRGYNVLGYTAAAVGNHEFDFGPLGAEAIPRNPGDDGLGALKRNADLAMFPFLSANMVEKATGKTPDWARRYTMVRAGGARIGIIGLSTPDTPNVTMAINVATLDFTDPIAATLQAARELRTQGADAIIVVAHIGGRCTKMDEPHDLASCDRSAEAVEYLEKLPAGTIDGFFAGHTHASMGHYVNGVPALQAQAMSREFSTLDLWVDTEQNRVTKSEIRPHTMICSFVYAGTTHCDPRLAPAGARLVPRTFGNVTIEPDARVAAAIAPYLRRVAARRDEKLGIRTDALFTRAYSAESPLGDLVADTLRRATGADIALMNSGGIRSELPRGDLTYGDMFAVSPFDNYPAMVIMSGAQLIELLRNTTTGARGIMQVSGIRYTFDAAKKGLERFVSATLEDGSPIDLQKMYSVIMPDFIAMGGDGSESVMATIPKDRVTIFYAAPLRDVLITELKKFNGVPIEPKTDGRITVLNPPTPR